VIIAQAMVIESAAGVARANARAPRAREQSRAQINDRPSAMLLSAPLVDRIRFTDCQQPKTPQKCGIFGVLAFFIDYDIIYLAPEGYLW
jgi:hypothetical protein